MKSAENTKDFRLLKLTNLVLLVTILALIMVWGTYAKYTSSATGVATATVAKWDISAGIQGEEVSITGDNAEVEFNLFDTILEENGTDEYDVLRDDEGKVIRIAPGTSGAFDLSIKNDSEVTAAYTIDFLVEGAEVPFEFNVNDNGWTTTLENVEETVIEMATSDVVNVQWKWAFEGNDTLDTSLGIENGEVTVTAILSVYQYDNTEENGGSEDDEESDDDRVNPLTLMVDNIEVTDENQDSFIYNPGETVSFTTTQGYDYAVWTIDNLDEQYSSNFINLGDGTATFTIPEGTEGSSWWVNVEISDETGFGISSVLIQVPAKEQGILEVGNFFTGEQSESYGTISENQWYPAGIGIEVEYNNSSIEKIILYKQDSETLTAGAEVYKEGTSVSIDEDGYYGIVLVAKEGQELDFETIEIYNFITKVN